MKDIFVAFVAVAVAAGGIYAWRSHVDPFRLIQFHGATVSTSAEQTQPAPTPPKPPAVKSKRAAPATAAPAEEAAALQRPVGPEARPMQNLAGPTVVVVRPPFPTADRIIAGSPEDSVTSTYGPPNIFAVTSANGRMVETLVYAQNYGRSQTVIRLEGGKVSSAYTKTLTPSAAGIPLTNPFQN